MSVHDRIGRLRDRYRERGPSAKDVATAWAGLTASAKAKLRAEAVDDEERRRDQEVLGQWAAAEGIDLTAEGEAAKEKLRGAR